ncbi:hypothetical protein SASPL_151838 [Salvia splendens]|uniref:Cyclin-like domain-containing protein n=1 Tax=Salvia splendens TaxID=180675 RepID=A0A8X8Z0C9_SALSN|nr:cyclin-D4-1-like isoform X2 [Salvia splendens]KAG6386669.1 hypothetical protein SASPL_151838 [Salvia splendens]
MAENRGFDCGAASDLLLCDEGTKSLCFDDGDFVETLNDQTGSDSDPFTPLPLLTEECVDWMVERETQHLPRNDYLMRLRSGELDLSLRREALDWMIKACGHHNFGEFCLYLAMSYLDRFLSVYNLPKGKHWVIQLIAVSCLSLAAKLEEVNVPSLVDLQAGDPKYLFEAKTIQRMEMLVLSYLKWNVKPYTPFNFIEFYLGKSCKPQTPQGPLLTKSTQIILSMIKGIDFLEFKPSEIAAAVASYVSGEADATQEKEGRVAKCLELIQDLMPISGAAALTGFATMSVASCSPSSSSTPSLPYSPNGVLDAACLSYKNDERSSPISKRRKLD